MLANFTVHGCACSGVSNPYGFGAYCARWETPTQNPWCYVLADCPTGGAAGDYGKFEDCAEALHRVVNNPADAVVAAEELRFAAEQFGHITGRFEIEAVLDVVFADFCIGK